MKRMKKRAWVQRMARSMGIETEGKTDEELLMMIGTMEDRTMAELGSIHHTHIPEGGEEVEVIEGGEEVEVIEGGEEVEVIEGGEEVEVDENEPNS